MPGSKKLELFMRFQVQFRAPAGIWKYVGPAGDSGFLPVGSGTTKTVQAGHNFTLQAPVKGQIGVRGEVTFEWRKGAEGRLPGQAADHGRASEDRRRRSQALQLCALPDQA